ncbi:MAG: hypothetical protein IH859_02045, partial [Chloroflexi bacterium]|nr:hypothetical protein [Chloroflexota bacterium]
YTCWLSDDTEITPGSLDLAVSILEAEPAIGMVGLKMQDVEGPLKHVEYLGALSEYGIMNYNHGVLPLSLVRSVGFFNEAYRSYMIDPDLTASVLSAGRKVVMTRQVSVLHHRIRAEVEGQDRVRRMMNGIDNEATYREKFRFLGRRYKESPLQKAWRQLVFRAAPLLFPNGSRWRGVSQRDVQQALAARFIANSDLWRHGHLLYHLVQRIPDRLLDSADNPYRDLATQAVAEASC